MSINDRLRAANTAGREAAKRYVEEEAARKHANTEEFRRLNPMVREVLDELGTELFGKSLGMLRRHRIGTYYKDSFGDDRWSLTLNDRGLRSEKRKGFKGRRSYFSIRIMLSADGDRSVFMVQKHRGEGHYSTQYSTDVSREALEEALVLLLTGYRPSPD